MNLTDEQIIIVEEMAAALMPAKDIAMLLDLSPEDRGLFVEVCKSHCHSPVYTAYHKGMLQTKYELQKTIIKLAKNGSPAAEPLAQKFLKEAT